MQKQGLINEFVKNHQKVIQYIDSLDDIEFSYTNNEKWTAGQQLEHILLTIIPLSKVLFSKEYIISKFGKIDRRTWNYEMVLENYSKTSLNAPEQFLPKNEITINQKLVIISNIEDILEQTKQRFEKYSEKELDTFTLPHPLLGKLTIRELFFLMSYHPLHHQKQIQEMLKNRNI